MATCSDDASVHATNCRDCLIAGNGEECLERRLLGILSLFAQVSAIAVKIASGRETEPRAAHSAGVSRSIRIAFTV